MPLIAASTRLRVGLGGSDSPDDNFSSCSGSRVLLYFITLELLDVAVSFNSNGVLSASGGNISAFLAYQNIMSSCQLSVMDDIP